jgi:hypothetical protein
LLTNLPARLQSEAQAILWKQDPEADIIFELPLDETFSISAIHAGRRTNTVISAVRKSCEVAEPIYYCLVSSPAIQGCSFLLQGDTRCIAIWMGALIIGQGLINRLLVTPTLAKRYRTKERPEASIGPLHGLDTFEAFQALREPRPFGSLNEDERDLVSNLNSQFAAFLISHEIAHVLNGHLFLSAARDRRELLEWEEFAHCSGDEQWTAHALEWDADMFAGMRIIGGSLQTSQSVESHFRFKSLEDRLRFRLYNTMISIYIACRLFQRRKFDPQTVLKERHPPGAMRLGLLMTQAYSAWIQLDSAAGIPFPGQILHEVVTVCEEAITDLTGVDEPTFHLLNVLPPDWAKSYQLALFAQWGEIHPELVKWKIGSHDMIPPNEVKELTAETLFGL